METITSLHNPKVAVWRSLSEKKSRDASGKFLVEGIKMVEEALKSGFPVDAVLLRQDFDPLFPLPADIPCFSLADHVFNSVCSTKTPQGIAAVIRAQSLRTGLHRSSSGRTPS